MFLINLKTSRLKRKILEFNGPYFQTMLFLVTMVKTKTNSSFAVKATNIFTIYLANHVFKTLYDNGIKRT